MIPEATCGKVSAQRRVSLWLLPPEPLRCELQTQINRISARSDGLCPPFLPHITILGGVPCSDKTEADEILSRLRSCLDIGYFDGGVPCCFGHNEVISVRTQNGAVKWNQSCAVIMKKTPDFLRIIRLLHGAFFPEWEGDVDLESAFPPPLREPHFSFAYGNKPELCERMSAPPDFVSKEAVLMWTYPSSLCGVQSWKEIGRIQLC